MGETIFRGPFSAAFIDILFPAMAFEGLCHVA